MQTPLNEYIQKSKIKNHNEERPHGDKEITKGSDWIGVDEEIVVGET